MDRKGQLFWIGGDCDPDTFSENDAKNYLDKIPHCRVKVKTGTMVVFSNY